MQLPKILPPFAQIGFIAFAPRRHPLDVLDFDAQARERVFLKQKRHDTQKKQLVSPITIPVVAFEKPLRHSSIAG